MYILQFILLYFDGFFFFFCPSRLFFISHAVNIYTYTYALVHIYIYIYIRLDTRASKRVIKTTNPSSTSGPGPCLINHGVGGGGSGGGN